MLDVIAELATLTSYRYATDVDDSSIRYRVAPDGSLEEHTRSHDGRVDLWLDCRGVDMTDVVMLPADVQLAFHRTIVNHR